MAETSREHEEANATNPTSKTERFVSKYFVRLLVSLAVGGGALAILGPWILYMLGCTDSTDSTLRLHILYMIGGVIAVLGLVETHRKNTVDREKAEVEKENYKKTQTHQASILEEQQRQFNATMDQEREKIESDRIKNTKYTLGDAVGTPQQLSNYPATRLLFVSVESMHLLDLLMNG